jgi:hypothetical protein
LDKLITKQISSAETVVQLSDVFNEWGGSFNYIHAAAALNRFAKLSRRGQGAQLLQVLVPRWLQLLPEAEGRACANVLWACVNLSKQRQQVEAIWEPTWAAFMQHVEAQSEEALVPQHLANAVYAAAQLRKQPTAAELQLLMQAFLRPEMLASAKAQEIANVAWALGQLSQARGWQGGVSEQDVQQLLGEQQLRVVADGNPQAVSNVLLGLANMAAGPTPLIGRTFAQQCSRQLLSLVNVSVSSSGPQHLTNTMWSTAKLGLPADVFVTKAVQVAPVWVPNSVSKDLTQAAQACAMLQYRDEAFLSLLLQRATGLLKQQQRVQGKAARGSQVLSAADRVNLVALLAAAVAQLDMRQLAGAARDLVASSGVGQQAKIHVVHPRRLWVIHAWLLQHQLLDGRGLTGLVTEQQLRQGEKDAAVYGTGVEALRGWQRLGWCWLFQGPGFFNCTECWEEHVNATATWCEG